MHKATIALLAALAVASALQIPNHNVHHGNYQNTKTGGQDVAQKQKYILQLLKNVSQKNMYPELVALGQAWNPEQFANQYAHPTVVKKFVSMYKQGMLPQGEIFHVHNDSHLKEAVALFDMFYFAKDFETFIQTAAWARDHVNEGQFVYALCVAAVHRDDCDATTDAHAYTQAIFNKNVNGFDNVFQTGPQYTPSHKLVNENIYQQDDEVRSFM
ncbi:basic juvenile hormone-suppressible protein 2-like [Frankliniella occidentalis]|uniref:Basic juvenile hormone-suppressible protein 2-like n=1 Tax=Frankliniella occidentalis TaxID=133901 RepID=A0A9C6U9M6_FRAOC|nr:basic juvenile hormone-suppressible protein 2-like [Frankliniella occidentalis]